MKINKQAFTLIELLVVVLIIGILVAVAVPQYRRSVEKSKATQAFVMLKKVAEAVRVYYLENGTYPMSFSELAVDIPWTGTIQWRVSSGTNKVQDTRSNSDWSLQLVSDGSYHDVWMGRISGKYRGAGFLVSLTSYNATGIASANDQIVCVERMSSGIVFQQKEGSYCNKLFNGHRFYTGTYRAYALP